MFDSLCYRYVQLQAYPLSIDLIFDFYFRTTNGAEKERRKRSEFIIVCDQSGVSFISSNVIRCAVCRSECGQTWKICYFLITWALNPRLIWHSPVDFCSMHELANQAWYCAVFFSHSCNRFFFRKWKMFAGRKSTLSFDSLLTIIKTVSAEKQMESPLFAICTHTHTSAYIAHTRISIEKWRFSRREKK